MRRRWFTGKIGALSGGQHLRRNKVVRCRVLLASLSHKGWRRIPRAPGRTWAHLGTPLSQQVEQSDDQDNTEPSRGWTDWTVQVCRKIGRNRTAHVSYSDGGWVGGLMSARLC
jgi:hypothetical protein